MLKDKRETLSFEKAIEAEESRIRENYEFIWFYKDVGYYYHQVKEYLDIFGEHSVKICFFDDLTRDTAEVMKDVFNFLEVDDCFSPDINQRHNVSEIKVNKSLNHFLNEYDHPIKKLLRPILLHTLGRKNTERAVNYFKDRNVLKLKSQTRKYLNNLYRDDILKLQDLTQRDLSSWL